jgi:hypothetical protein
MLHRQKKTLAQPQWCYKQNVGRINMNFPKASALWSVYRRADEVKSRKLNKKRLIVIGAGELSFFETDVD